MRSSTRDTGALTDPWPLPTPFDAFYPAGTWQAGPSLRTAHSSAVLMQNDATRCCGSNYTLLDFNDTQQSVSTVTPYFPIALYSTKPIACLFYDEAVGGAVALVAQLSLNISLQVIVLPFDLHLRRAVLNASYTYTSGAFELDCAHDGRGRMWTVFQRGFNSSLLSIDLQSMTIESEAQYPEYLGYATRAPHFIHYSPKRRALYSIVSPTGQYTGALPAELRVITDYSTGAYKTLLNSTQLDLNNRQKGASAFDEESGLWWASGALQKGWLLVDVDEPYHVVNGTLNATIAGLPLLYVEVASWKADATAVSFQRETGMRHEAGG